MTGDKLTLLLILQYFFLAGVFAYEQKWGKAIYFAGAVILTIGVLWNDPDTQSWFGRMMKL